MHLDENSSALPTLHQGGQPHGRNSVKTTDVMAYARLMLMMPDGTASQPGIDAFCQ